MPPLHSARPKHPRFILAPGEAIQASAEVVADTRFMARAWRMLYVTDRRIVLCDARYFPFFVIEAALLATSALSLDDAAPWARANAYIEQGCIAGIVIVALLRARLKRRRLTAEIPIRDVDTVERAGKSIILGLADGGTWRLAPSKILLVIWSPLSRSAIETAASEIQHALGLPAVKPRKRPDRWKRAPKRAM